MKKYMIFSIKFIASFLAVLLSFNPTISLSASSLQALMNPTLAADLGIKAATAAPIVPVAAPAVPVAAQVLSPTGAVLGTAFAGSFTPAASTTSALALAAGAVGIAGATAAVVSSLQDTALSKHCALNGCSFTITYTSVWNGVQTRQTNFLTEHTNDSCGAGYWISFTYGGDCIIPGSLSRNDITWPQLTQQQRDIAVSLLTTNDYSSAITNIDNSISTTTINMIKNYINQTFNTSTSTQSQVLNALSAITFNITPTTIVTSSGLSSISVPVNLSQFDQTFETNINTQIQAWITQTYTTNTNTNTNTNSITGTVTNTQTNPETGEQTQTQSQINLQLPEPEGDIDDDDCDDIECISKFQNQPNFIEYAIEKLSNKFPFDIYDGSALQGGPNSCPQLVIFGKQKQICELNLAVKSMKYPIWIGYLIYSLHTL
jgi:hypothetical protein